MKEDDGSTPLHYAAWRNPNLEVIKYFVSQGGLDINAKTDISGGGSPLHYAVGMNRDAEVVKYFVSIGADIHAKNRHHEMPLMAAKRSHGGSEAIIQYPSSLN